MNHLWLALAGVAAATYVPQSTAIQFDRSFVGTNVTVCIDGRKVETSFAGKLQFHDAQHSWTSVCADVRAPISPGQMYGVQPVNTARVGGNIAKAGNIVAHFFNAAQTPEQCAGLQLAVWEAIEDGGPTPDFASGHFQAHASLAVIAYATQYYEAVGRGGTAFYLQAGGGAAGQSGNGGGQTSGGGAGAGQGGGGGQGQISP